MQLKRTGYILTVYTDYDAYKYLFQSHSEACQQAAEYTAIGVQNYITIQYTIEKEVTQ